MTDPKQLDLDGKELGRMFTVTVTERTAYTDLGVRRTDSAKYLPKQIRAAGYVEAIEQALADWPETEGVELTVR